MHLREGEHILKVVRHHPTPFVFNLIKVVIGSFPFFMMLFLFKSAVSSQVFFYLNTGVVVLFALIVVYVSLIYWLDKLVITNLRIVHEDWKYLTVRNEAEALLDDIADIRTKEKGLLAHFWIFDYGLLRVDTPSSYVTLEFFDAPDPEGIRKFIYHIKKQ